MADTKISDMTAAVSVADADLVPVVQGGANKRATVDLILDALTAARVATAIGSTAANLVYAGPGSGAAAVPAARALVAADIPSLSAVYLPIGGGTLTGALVLSGAPTIDLHAATKVYVDGIIAALNASNLTSGTVPDARFPATLPALNGSALTALNASNLGSGTVPDARFPAVLPAISGANLTNLPGGISGLTTGALPYATSGTAIADSNIFRCAAQRIGFGGTTDSFPGMRWSSEFFVDFVRAAAGAFIGVNAGYYQLSNLSKLQNVANGVVKVTDDSDALGSLRAAALDVHTANGAESNIKTISESITLSTGGLTTDSTADLLPANSIILAVTARITSQITATTNWALGDATTVARFAAANATLAAGTTAVGVAHQQGSVATDAAGPVQIAAAKLRITCTGANPGAGVVRVTVTFLSLTPPTS